MKICCLSFSVKCEQKTIKHAYHTICVKCGVENNVCEKCGMKVEDLERYVVNEC